MRRQVYTSPLPRRSSLQDDHIFGVMGKADVERDYYGDLELEPTADPNEIKRQFKKLGTVSYPNE